MAEKEDIKKSVNRDSKQSNKTSWFDEIEKAKLDKEIESFFAEREKNNQDNEEIDIAKWIEDFEKEINKSNKENK